MTPTKCCVVGGAGFIGMHVTRVLVARDVVVIAAVGAPTDCYARSPTSKAITAIATSSGASRLEPTN
jgi:nucleoside-diphosphate-sugar epimerase